MRIFLDMDGVLADFDAGYEKRFGVRPDKASDNVDWQLVRSTPNFYRDLPPMPDCYDLLLGLSKLGIRLTSLTILTGVPANVPEALANKRAWVEDHIPPIPIIGCRSKEKCLHGQAGDVLIDDWDRYKGLWEGMGGHWITHTSAASSLQQLRELLSQRG